MVLIANNPSPSLDSVSALCLFWALRCSHGSAVPLPPTATHLSTNVKLPTSPFFIHHHHSPRLASPATPDAQPHPSIHTPHQQAADPAPQAKQKSSSSFTHLITAVRGPIINFFLGRHAAHGRQSAFPQVHCRLAAGPRRHISHQPGSPSS